MKHCRVVKDSCRTWKERLPQRADLSNGKVITNRFASKYKQTNIPVEHSSRFTKLQIIQSDTRQTVGRILTERPPNEPRPWRPRQIGLVENSHVAEFFPPRHKKNGTHIKPKRVRINTLPPPKLLISGWPGGMRAPQIIPLILRTIKLRSKGRRTKTSCLCRTTSAFFPGWSYNNGEDSAYSAGKGWKGSFCPGQKVPLFLLGAYLFIKLKEAVVIFPRGALIFQDFL